MKIDDPLEQWMADKVPPEILLIPLSDEAAGKVIERLKQAADAHWHIDPNRSLEFAERIIAVGQARNDTRQAALGLMARGDALRFLWRIEEAWTVLEQAGNMFRSAGDDVGWARTRIGRLSLGLELNHVTQVLEDAREARDILKSNGEDDKLLRLYWEMASVHIHRGEQNLARELYDSALEIAHKLGQAGQRYLGPLYTHLGATYNVLGDFQQAINYYEQARSAFAPNEALNIASVERNIAEIAQAQGQYRRALALLQSALERVANISSYQATMIKQQLVECYLSLNRNMEARDLAQQVIVDYRTLKANYELAYTLLCLATAEATLGNFAAAQSALDEAEPIFVSLKADTWVAMTHLRRSWIALRQGRPEMSFEEADLAAKYFETSGQQFNMATATLRKSQALFALGNLSAALTEADRALHAAQRDNIPSLRYSAYFLLGQIAEAGKQEVRAIHFYRAASATVERVQRGLTITLRSGFLEDKGDALRALIAMQLRAGNARNALETLERAKSQIWLGYLVNREHLRWSQEDQRSRALIDELDHLRAEHRWFSQLAHELPRDSEHASAILPEQALVEIGKRERRMRMITEQLYLQSGNQSANPAPIFSLEEIQQSLNEDTLLIEYYNDGEQLWAFALSNETVSSHRLPLTVGSLHQLIGQLQVNIAAALQVNPKASGARNLTQLAQRILKRLHDSLVQPLAIEHENKRRLLIVPYGSLHFLPFQLLYDGSAYLIERYEVVILPAAGLATRTGPKRPSGALVLGHSWEGKLPHTHTEAQIVHRLFGGLLCLDDDTNRSALRSKPTQILHIAAHGHYRLDQPDLSYLELTDGQLYTDDVLQHDLSYELVTLSACETGRANVAADEELVGLGRGFLYAGAGALVLSLWGVADSSTTDLMERMYCALRRGESKSASLRGAQTALLAENRDLHPAFWGAFQLIGDDRPLSVWAD